jgi:hypothetical protein
MFRFFSQEYSVKAVAISIFTLFGSAILSAAVAPHADATSFSFANDLPVNVKAFEPGQITISVGCYPIPVSWSRVLVEASSIKLRIAAPDFDELNCGPNEKTLPLPPLGPGVYSLYATDPENAFYLTAKLYRVLESPPRIQVSSVALNFDTRTSTMGGPQVRYFITGRSEDVPLLLSLNTAPNRAGRYEIADAGFKAWPAAGPAPAAALPVCRFFSPAISSHFYSIRPEDCALLRSLPTLWTDEGIVFRILPATGGVCGFGTQAVYRLYSSEQKNHRYTAEVETYRGMQLEGWSGEGAAFCAPVD